MNLWWDFIENLLDESTGFSEGELLFIRDTFENENFTDIYDAINKIDNFNAKKNYLLMIINILTMFLNAKTLKQSKKDDKRRILKEAIKIMNETNTKYTPPHIKKRREATIRDLEYELASMEVDFNPKKDRLRLILKHISESEELNITPKQIKNFVDSIKITEDHIKFHTPRY